MYNQGVIYNQHSLWGPFWGIRTCDHHQSLKKRKAQKTEVKDMKEETVITSETCSSTSLRRLRTLDMNWMAERQDGGGGGRSALSGWGFVSACVWSTCLSFTTEKGCRDWGWSWGLGRVFGGGQTKCSAASLILTSNWKGWYTHVSCGTHFHSFRGCRLFKERFSPLTSQILYKAAKHFQSIVFGGISHASTAWTSTSIGKLLQPIFRLCYVLPKLCNNHMLIQLWEGLHLKLTSETCESTANSYM